MKNSHLFEAAKLLLLLLLGIEGKKQRFSFLHNPKSKLTVKSPQGMDRELDHRDSLFGSRPFGGSIEHNVYYVNDLLCATDDAIVDEEVLFQNGFPKRETDTNGKMIPWPSPFIIIVDRGDCTFVTKVRNAQRAGASAVIIASNVCRCGEEGPSCRRSSKTCEIADPIMADDGSGADISIPSMLVFKSDADALKDTIKNNTQLVMEMSYPLLTSDDVLEYDFFTSAAEVLGNTFASTWKPFAKALGNSSYFTPHQYIQDGARSNCAGAYEENLCLNLCTNSGRYCCSSTSDEIPGADVVKESLRRMCIWRHHGEDDGIGEKWWDYISEFEKRCRYPNLFAHEDCVMEVCNVVGIDKTVINRCMIDSGGFGQNRNSNLDWEIGTQTEMGAYTVPTTFVNTVATLGSLTAENLFAAICNSFAEGAAPAVCTECLTCELGMEVCVQNNKCGPNNAVGDTTAPVQYPGSATIPGNEIGGDGANDEEYDEEYDVPIDIANIVDHSQEEGSEYNTTTKGNETGLAGSNGTEQTEYEMVSEVDIEGANSTAENSDGNTSNQAGLENCIQDKCAIQLVSCKKGSVCEACFQKDTPDYCFNDEAFNAVTNCVICQCTDNSNDASCESSANHEDDSGSTVVLTENEAEVTVTAIEEEDGVAECGPGEEAYRLIMYDSLKDGWDTTQVNIKMKGSNNVVFTGKLEDGSYGEEIICLSTKPTCYSAETGGAVWGVKSSWEITPLRGGPEAIAVSRSPTICQFNVAGGDCENTCIGGAEFDPFQDPEYVGFKKLKTCIEDRCVIQLGSCREDSVCADCFKEDLAESCFENVPFSAVIDCGVCQCTDRNKYASCQNMVDSAGNTTNSVVVSEDETDIPFDATQIEENTAFYRYDNDDDMMFSGVFSDLMTAFGGDEVCGLNIKEMKDAKYPLDAVTSALTDEKCESSQEVQFLGALEAFETCSGWDIQEILETLPSALTGTAVNCLTNLHYREGQNMISAFTAYAECAGILLGDNPLGNAMKRTLLQPEKNCMCLGAQLSDSQLPECELDLWPMPIFGSAVKSFSCLVMNFVCPNLEMICNLSELQSLGRCLQSATSCNVDCPDSILLNLPPPLSYMPLPDVCRKEYFGVSSNIVDLYDKYVAQCSDGSGFWDIHEASHNYASESTLNPTLKPTLEPTTLKPSSGPTLEPTDFESAPPSGVPTQKEEEEDVVDLEEKSEFLSSDFLNGLYAGSGLWAMVIVIGAVFYCKRRSGHNGQPAPQGDDQRGLYDVVDAADEGEMT